MDVVLEHLKEYYVAYVVVVICALPVLFFTRKWSVPIILYAIEVAIYLGLMHLAFFLLVRLTRWFKENSSMRALREDGRPVDAPEWGTPLLEFWKREAYDPSWIIWVEVAVAVLIVFLVWRYRPMRVQRKRKRPGAAPGKGKKSYAAYGRPNYAENLGTAKVKKGRR